MIMVTSIVCASSMSVSKFKFTSTRGTPTWSANCWAVLLSTLLDLPIAPFTPTRINGVLFCSGGEMCPWEHEWEMKRRKERTKERERKEEEIYKKREREEKHRRRQLQAYKMLSVERESVFHNYTCFLLLPCCTYWESTFGRYNFQLYNKVTRYYMT